MALIAIVSYWRSLQSCTCDLLKHILSGKQFGGNSSFVVVGHVPALWGEPQL